MKTRVLIDGHGLIQALGKPRGYQTSGDYADVFIKCDTSLWIAHNKMWYLVATLGRTQSR